MGERDAVRALAPFLPYLRGAPAGLPFEWSRATSERGLNFTLTTSIGDLDLLGEITGAGPTRTWSRMSWSSRSSATPA